MTYDFTKHKDDALTKPRDLCWENWAKFEKVGDSVQGFIRDVFFRPGDDDFSNQRALTLEQPDNKGFINVGIKHLDFILAKTNNLRLGDPVTIVFEKELPPKEKKHSPTKQMGFYGKNLEENANEKTVAELEAEDKGEAATQEKKTNDEFNAVGTTPEEPKPADDITPEEVADKA